MAGFFGRGAGYRFGLDPLGYNPPASDGSSSGYGMGTGLDMSVPQDPYAGQRVDAQPGFFGKTAQNLKGIDWGSTILGGLADGVAKWGGAEPQFAKGVAENNKLQQEYAKAIAVEKLKQANPDPTMLQRNYEYLKSVRPDLAETYLRAQSNPVTLSTDPATGNARFIPKGGVPQSKVVGGTTYYSPNGADWYDNPEYR
jgi:hypothetical protein